MKSVAPGPSTSPVEVTNVSAHGFWLFTRRGGEESVRAVAVSTGPPNGRIRGRRGNGRVCIPLGSSPIDDRSPANKALERSPPMRSNAQRLSAGR